MTLLPPTDSELLAQVAANPALPKLQREAAAKASNQARQRAERANAAVVTLPDSASQAMLSAERWNRAASLRGELFLPRAADGKTPIPVILFRGPLFTCRRIPSNLPDAASEFFPSSPRGEHYARENAEAFGPFLGSFDRRVFAACLALFRDLPVTRDGEAVWVTVSLSDLLRLIPSTEERSVQDNAESRTAIRASLSRLNATSLKVSRNGVDVAITGLVRSAVTGTNIGISLAGELAGLFGPNTWLGIDRVVFSAQARDLKAWLVAFYSTHAEPKGLDIERLRRLCGFDGSLPRFRSKLAAALEGLKSEKLPDGIRVRSYSPDTLSMRTEKIEVDMMHFKATGPSRK